MLTFHLTMDPDSRAIHRDDKHIGHLLKHDGNPRVQLTRSLVDQFLTKDELEACLQELNKFAN